jgi:hypothetical protein
VAVITIALVIIPVVPGAVVASLVAVIALTVVIFVLCWSISTSVEWRMIGRHTTTFTDLFGAISELLNLRLCQDTKDNDAVHAFFEALLGVLECLGVDEAAVDPRPSSANRDIFALKSIFVGCYAFTDGLRLFRELLSGLA